MVGHTMFDAYAALKCFEAYLLDYYDIGLLKAREKPHFLGFLDYIIEPASDRPDLQFFVPLSVTNLPALTRRLAPLLRMADSPIRITNRSYEHIERLIAVHSRSPRQAVAISRENLRRLLAAIDMSAPRGLRLYAVILCLWVTMARPSELLERRYPEDLSADYDEGIVITVPRTKTNPEGECFAIRHERNAKLCPICALRRWLEWLGPDYSGYLFPSFRSHTDRLDKNHFSVPCLINALRPLSSALGVRPHFTSYSFRRGAATTAARARWGTSQIQHALRHASIIQSLRYIDRPGLFDLMDRIV